MNLLQETIIRMSPYTPDDIIFIGSDDGIHQCDWPTFKELADRDYDEGFGSHEVALDLIIIFKDGARLRRWEYDGSEGWALDVPVTRGTQPVTSLFVEYDYE